MISRPRDMFPGHNLFNQNIIRPFVGPWGSLVSFVLGVYVTPVQIRTGPLILSSVREDAGFCCFQEATVRIDWHSSF